MHTTQHETLSEPLLLTIPQTAKMMGLGHTNRSYVQIVVVVLE
jgi:hypothetical protein